MNARTYPATVASTLPLAVNMYGEDPPVDVPAETVGSYTPVIGDAVRVEIRDPLVPLIIGVVA